MTDELNGFAAAVEASHALQEQLAAAAGDYANAVVAIAAEAGFAITADQVRAAQSEDLPTEWVDTENRPILGGA